MSRNRTFVYEVSAKGRVIQRTAAVSAPTPSAALKKLRRAYKFPITVVRLHRP